MIILELTSRISSPLSARIALLVLLGVIFLIYTVRDSWLRTNVVLFSLPLQRFKWQSESLLSSRFNRYVSAFSASLAMGIYLYSHLFYSTTGRTGGFMLGFYELIFLILGLFFLKHYGMKLYFLIHEETQISSVVIDLHCFSLL